MKRMQIDEFAKKFLGIKLTPYQRALLRVVDETPDPKITYRPVELNDKIWRFPELKCSDCGRVYKKRGWLNRHRRLKHFILPFRLISLMGIGVSKSDRLAGLRFTV